MNKIITTGEKNSSIIIIRTKLKLYLNIAVISIILQLYSCVMDPPKESLGEIKNESKKKLMVSMGNKSILNDSDVLKYYKGLGKYFIITPMSSDGMSVWPADYNGLKNGQKLCFNFYDEDILMKYFNQRIILNVAKKAFLKRDTVTQEEVLKKNLLLTYKEKQNK